jgi:hypothetical protein
MDFKSCNGVEYRPHYLRGATYYSDARSPPGHLCIPRDGRTIDDVDDFGCGGVVSHGKLDSVEFGVRERLSARREKGKGTRASGLWLLYPSLPQKEILTLGRHCPHKSAFVHLIAISYHVSNKYRSL